MKTNFILVAGLAVLLAAGCEEAMVSIPTLTVKSKTVELTAAASSSNVSVESNTAWKVSVDDSFDWLSAEKNEDGIVVSAKANPSNDEREGTVQVIAGTKTINISVIQEGSPISITVDKSSIEATVAGLETTFTITSNVAWRAEASEGWVNVGTTKGDAGTSTISVSVPAYDGYEERQAEIGLFFGYSKKAVVTVSQEAFVVSFDVSDTSFEADKAGGSKTISVSSNIAWTVSTDADWITPSPASGEAGANQAVTLTYPEASGSEREATVTFTAGNVTKTVAIHQDKGEEKLKDDIVFDLVFATVNDDGATGTSYKIVTPALVTSAASSYDIGVKTYTLNNYSGYSIEIYGSYVGSLLNTKAGLICVPAIVSGKTTKAIRADEGFGYVKFPAIADYKLASVKLVTSPIATSTVKFPVYITPTYGTSNAEAIAAAVASNADVGRKGLASPTVLNLASPAENTAYYLFMPQGAGSASTYQYQFLEIHMTYKDATTPGL